MHKLFFMKGVLTLFTYVMSDLHGEYDKYVKMLEKINFNEKDILYVLGDVVDRGKNPMKILLDMMLRPNVFPLLGNHDLIALNVLEALKYELSEKNGKVSENLAMILGAWLEEGGATTVGEFYTLTGEQQYAVIDYLKEFSLFEIAETEDKAFVLVHSGLDNYRPDKKLCEYTEDELLFCRPSPSEKYFEDDEDIYVVMGHTPTPIFPGWGKPEILKNGKNIFIDCAACNPKGKLACLCLETMEEYYI